jgi:hypothetical protein
LCRSISIQSRSAHTHTRTLASRRCEECAQRGGKGAPLAMVVDLYCGGVVVGSSPSSSSTTIFRFRPAKQQSINTRRRIATVACFSRVTPAVHAYE